MEEKVLKTMKALEKNNMKPFYVETKEDVIPLLNELLADNETVSCGGSVTLSECGILDYLRKGNFVFLDRYKENLTREEINDIFKKSFFCDTYFTSTNAITEQGQLYNVDGNSNRISAIAFGPKSVIVIAGINKIVKDIDEAVLRVKNVVAPKNAARLSMDTYCAKAGHCVVNDASYGGCTSKDRICCSRLICDQQRIKDRIKVILVGEEIGF